MPINYTAFSFAYLLTGDYFSYRQ